MSLEEGEIHWKGDELSRVAQDFRASLVWFSHRTGLKGDLTPLENLAFESGLRTFRSHRYVEALERVAIADCSALPVRSMSAGQQRRVGLARMVLAAAPLWMLDEPFTNLDTSGQGLVRELLVEHLRRGGASVVATHQAVDLDVTTHRLRL